MGVVMSCNYKKFTNEELEILFYNKKIIADLDGDIYFCRHISLFETDDKTASAYPIISCKKNKCDEFSYKRVFFTDLTRTDITCKMIPKGWKNKIIDLQTVNINKISGKKMFEPVEFFISRLKTGNVMSNADIINKIVEMKHKRRVEKSIRQTKENK